MTRPTLIGVIVTLLLLGAVIGAGCLSEPTGCMPVTVEGKSTTASSNVMGLHVTISGEDYLYYNPKLDTFSQIEIGKTYLMRFIPMVGSKPEVEFCKEQPVETTKPPSIFIDPQAYQGENKT
jgi:hypothetical protein